MARVALVTGGATGIGAAIVDRFLAAGWNVVLGYFGADEADLAEAVRMRAAASERIVLPVALDVTSDAACRDAAAQASARFGRLDAAVSSAGTTRVVPQRDLDALDAEDFALTMRVNTLGPFQIVRACASLLRAARGAVVIVSSYGGLHGAGSSIAYAASKGAANTLTLSLARILAPDVRVNAVCPAIVTDGYVARIDPAGFAARAAGQVERAPLRRIATPDDVARDIFWLAAETVLMTGQVIALDCGLHLNADTIGE